jgi:hypothetical protein
MTGILLLPILALLHRRDAQQLRAPPWNGAGIMAVVLALAFADSLLNSTLPLVFILSAGALSQAREVSEAPTVRDG